MARAEKIARHIVTLPPVAVRMMKEFVLRFGELPVEQSWHVQSLINALLMQATADAQEGRNAFNEKRPPKYDGALRQKGEPYPELGPEDEARLMQAYRSGEFCRSGLRWLGPGRAVDAWLSGKAGILALIRTTPIRA